MESFKIKLEIYQRFKNIFEVEITDISGLWKKVLEYRVMKYQCMQVLNLRLKLIHERVYSEYITSSRMYQKNGLYLCWQYNTFGCGKIWFLFRVIICISRWMSKYFQV
uniref:Uncharacterized protein n=1 Tax=Micrurus lemniscatus lemniscatus TaxID=129467 RepID=A0A2D4ISB8_MICLE